MRVGILLVGILIWFFAFIQVTLVGNLSDWADDESTQTAAALGFFGLVLWLFALIVVIPWPRLSMLAFVFAAALMYGGASDFPDLGVWGTVAAVFAILSYVGLRQKRTKERKEADRDAMMEQMLRAQQTMAGVMTTSITTTSASAASSASVPSTTHTCPACGATVMDSQKFCPDCGTAQGPAET